MSTQNEQIDANIVIKILQDENAELRWQLTLLKAKALQEAQARSEAHKEG
jgi:hypothetical protein